MLVPEDPDQIKRTQEPKTEADSNSKPVNERLAIAFGSFGGICGLVAFWANVSSHVTTFIWAIVIGVLSFILSACFHLRPRKNRKQDEDDEQKLQDNRLLSLGLNMPEPHHRASELSETAISKSPKPPPTDEVQADKEALPPFKPFTDPKTGAVHTIPFESGLGTLWTEYTEDVFDNIIWRWRYNAHIDQSPRNLHPYCIECQQPMRKTQTFYRQSMHSYYVQVTCNRHAFYHVPTNSQGDFIGIKQRIQQKIQDWTWVDVVNKGDYIFD